MSPTDLDYSAIIRALEALDWEVVDRHHDACYFTRPDGGFVWLQDDDSHHVETLEWWLQANGVDVARFWEVYTFQLTS